MKSFVIIFFLLSDPTFVVDYKLGGFTNKKLCSEFIDELKERWRLANTQPPIFGMRCEPGGKR